MAREPGVWKRWALIALVISAGLMLQALVREALFGDGVDPLAFLVFSAAGVIVGFPIIFLAFVLAELWSRHRGPTSVRVETTLPSMPTRAWVWSALKEADRECAIDTVGGNEEHLAAEGRRNVWFSRRFHVTIDRIETGARVAVGCVAGPKFLDRGSPHDFAAQFLAALQWRCEEAVNG